MQTPDKHVEPKKSRTFPCEQCGGKMHYSPDEDAHVCDACGSVKAVEGEDTAIEEVDYHGFLAQLERGADYNDASVVKCESCGARTDFSHTQVASSCAFCASPLVTTKEANRQIKPASLLPFDISKAQVYENFRVWLKKQWFAPSNLKQMARIEGQLRGIYVPYWTYDSNTDSRYRGMRGDHYYVSETYTAIENGKTVTKTRSVRKTRWSSASGRVKLGFDDVLVCASESLPREYSRQLEPWDLQNLKSYKDHFLAGYEAECYQVDLPGGFEFAKQRMLESIRRAVRSDIGGDEQQITSLLTDYQNISFKHILLPLWMFTYRYKKKIYRVMINARSGEVIGERPWSWIKITLAVLLGVAVVAGVIFLFNNG